MDDIIRQIAQQCLPREVAAIGLTVRWLSYLLNDQMIWRPVFGKIPIIHMANSRYYFMAAKAERKIINYIDNNSLIYSSIKEGDDDNRVYLRGNDKIADILFGVCYYFPVKFIGQWSFAICREYSAYFICTCGSASEYNISKDEAIEILRTYYHQY